MAKQPSEGKFVLFQNVKQKDTHPDYRGEIMLNGEVKEIVAWLKRDGNDEQFLSGSINPKKIGDIKREVDGNKLQ